MKSSLIVLLIGAALTAGLFVFFQSKLSQARRDRQELQAAIDSIAAAGVRGQKLFSLDSLRSVMEKRIIDSLTIFVEARDKRIDALQKEITINRRENEALEKRFNDIVISMPEY